MTSIIIALAIILISTANVWAWNEPDSFRGVPWGASEKELRVKLSPEGDGRFFCRDYPSEEKWLGERWCTDSFVLASSPIEATYSFREDRFKAVSLKYSPGDFATILRVFTERYGQPTGKSGGSVVWFGQRVVITIGMTTGSVMTLKEAEEMTKLREKQTRDAAKGL